MPKKDNNYEITFVGTKKGLCEYWSTTRANNEPIEEFFGNLDEMPVGTKLDHVMLNYIIYRKEKNTYLLFSRI